MHDPLARYRSAVSDIPARLAEHGLALICGLADAAALLDLASSLTTVVPHRDSDADGITTITDRGAARVRHGFAGFSAEALSPHTDRSGVPQPPRLLLTSCRQPGIAGGECVLIDGKAVYDDLAESAPDALRAFRTPRSALFGGAAGHLGSVFTDLGNCRMSVRLRLDELAWFSPQVSRWLPTLRVVLDRHAHTFSMATGEGYVLDNWRWLHGRHAFLGQRVLYRITGDPLPHLAIPTGFRPSRQLLPKTAA
ncbi:TauD/TfdA family dioxygenase [Amycolatopsis cihanbeyliensis]|uniref:Alpha-ketoglutarate-dependent taurine dioxygenase n=1 Tax=Amycolatopsis cihanbeyliensis TaxID=1128664 RepID=A0A542DMQ7_AMYCI|nr:TauD/TfdA family dioxygenase [Amycolatopsis cihanbeyliensis]TQJ04275.1 alpha-ketoglutarate-dependent taurine dioxygenase [Amycolatopsis cihanbeyliensis]